MGGAEVGEKLRREDGYRGTEEGMKSREGAKPTRLPVCTESFGEGGREGASFTRLSMKNVRATAPAHCAMDVAAAAPAGPHPKTKTKMRSSTRLRDAVARVMASGVQVSCIDYRRGRNGVRAKGMGGTSP